MLHKSLEELAQTEGGRCARKIIKQNQIVRTCYLLFVFIGCFGVLFWASKMNGDMTAIYYFIASTLGLGLCVRIYFTRIHRILTEECDPFKAEEVYLYYYLAYAKKKLERRSGPSAKWLYHLYISYSVMLQGDFERAFFILNQIDRRELDRSRQYLICRFHQNMRMYYCYKKDAVVLHDMRNYFIRMSKDLRIRRQYRKWIKKEIEMIDLHLSLSRRDFSIYENLSRRPGWTKGVRLQRVANRWVDAIVHNMQNDPERAKMDCRYVLENGNRLYYVSMAERMLCGSDAACTVTEST